MHIVIDILGMSEYAVFGYGSLILPPSAIARFADLPPIDPVYESGLTLGDAGLVRQEALDAWETRRDDFTLIPAKVHGFRREYTYESWRGGAMLEARYTGRDEDMMNGVLISGYSEDEYTDITGSEEGYEEVTLDAEDFETYTDTDVRLNHPVTVYGAGETSSGSWPTRARNRTYHSRILAGIEMLGDEFGEALADRFREDFIQTTYEVPISGGTPVPLTHSIEAPVYRAWLNTVEQNNHARMSLTSI